MLFTEACHGPLCPSISLLLNNKVLLTAPGVQRASLYILVALLESAKTHRPPVPHSHQGPGCAVACTAEKGGRLRLKSVMEQNATNIMQ